MPELSIEVAKIDKLNIEFTEQINKLAKKHEFSSSEKEIKKFQRISKKEDKSFLGRIIDVTHLISSFKEMNRPEFIDNLNGILSSYNLVDEYGIASSFEKYLELKKDTNVLKGNISNSKIKFTNDNLNHKSINITEIDTNLNKINRINGSETKRQGFLGKLKSFVSKYFAEAKKVNIESSTRGYDKDKNPTSFNQQYSKKTNGNSCVESSQNAEIDNPVLFAETSLEKKLKKLKSNLSKMRKQKKEENSQQLNELIVKRKNLADDLTEKINLLHKEQMKSLKESGEYLNYQLFTAFANRLSIEIIQIIDIADRFNIDTISEFTQRSKSIIDKIEKERAEQEELEWKEQKRQEAQEAYYRRCRQCDYFNHCPMVGHLDSPCPQFAPNKYWY